MTFGSERVPCDFTETTSCDDDADLWTTNYGLRMSAASCADADIAAAASAFVSMDWPLDTVQVLPAAGFWAVARRSSHVGGVPLTKPWIFVVLQPMACSPGFSAISTGGGDGDASGSVGLTKCERCTHPYTSQGGVSECNLCLSGFFQDPSSSNPSECRPW